MGKLTVKDVHVIAHETPGHATWNPYVIDLWCKGDHSDEMYVEEPRGEYWRRWIKALRTTDLRYRFPFMSCDEIEAELDDSES
jgi:hypothetical protein